MVARPQRLVVIDLADDLAATEREIAARHPTDEQYNEPMLGFAR